MKKYRMPIFAILCALIITTAMDFTGYSTFSSMPLLLIIIIFWLVERLRIDEIGLKFGPLKYYGYALLYPFLVLGILVLVAFFARNVEVGDVNYRNIFAGSTIGVIMVMLTEEGFFRGWLWGSFQRAGLSNRQTLLVTSILFTIWHISAVTSGTDYGLPASRIPIYLTNALLLGLNWGMLRNISGSVIVPSLCHAVWNALAYDLFGFGEKAGSLGIDNTALYGPEVGYLGILFNVLFFLWLWNRSKKEGKL